MDLSSFGILVNKWSKYQETIQGHGSKQTHIHTNVIYWVDAATQHCRIAFTELDTNLGKNQKYQLF